MLLGALTLASMCGGCIVGVKPASDTILQLTRVDESGKSITCSCGFEYVYFDTLQNGYGVISWGYHPRDHETYLYLFYDDYSHTRNWDRRLLITPMGKASPDRTATYRLELYLPDSVLSPGMKDSGSCHLFTGVIGPPAEAADSQIRFDLKDVTMTSRGSKPIKITLRGTIVATKVSPSEFEYKLKEWNKGVW